MLSASEKAVRVTLLSLVQQLKLPEKPSDKQVLAAASAADSLRRRILGERDRVNRRIRRMETDVSRTALRDPNALMEDDDSDEFGVHAERRRQYTVEAALREDKTRELTRHEFLFVAEMQAKGSQSVVVDAMCLHALRHSAVLLSPMLKLLACMTDPPERLCGDRLRVVDAVEHMRRACATDDFFSLILQCVAPITGKRRDGALSRRDVHLLELSLQIFINLLTGPDEGHVVPVVGAMCRSHGVELLLVILHQNYSRFLTLQQVSEDQPSTLEEPDERPHSDAEAGLATQHEVQTAAPEEITREENLASEHLPGESCLLDEAQGTILEIVDDAEAVNVADEILVVADDLVVLDNPPLLTSAASDSSAEGGTEDKSATGDSDDESEEESAEDESDEDEDEDLQILDDAFKHDMELANMLRQDEKESGDTAENLLTWNLLILNAIALILRCGVPAIELASWSPESDTANVFALVEKNAARLRQRQTEEVTWRQAAKHRNGSTASTGLLVRRRDTSDPAPRMVLGSVSAMLAGSARTPLQRLMDADKKKRAKFNRKNLTQTGATHLLPIPTLLHLTKQIALFLSSGFEALSLMVWQHVRAELEQLEATLRELKDVQALPSFVDQGPMLSDLNGLSLAAALQYCGTVAAMLRLTRESLRQHRELSVSGQTLSADAHRLLEEHWRAASHVITLEHMQRGFDLLGAFAVSKELFSTEDVCVAMDYVSEMLLVLGALMSGEIVDDPSVTMPAHALGSSLLFNEGNVRTVWLWIGHPRVSTHRQLQSATLLLHGIFSLMERCSFNGSFAVPKRKATGAAAKKARSAAAALGSMADPTTNDSSSASGSGSDDDDDEAAKAFIDDDDEARRRQRRAQLKEAAPAEMVAVDAGGGLPDEVEEGAFNAMHHHEETLLDDDEPVASPAADATLSLSVPRRSASRDTAGHHSTSSAGHVSLTSEREAHVDDFYMRLATPKSAQMLLRMFQFWRLNEPEPGNALEALLDRLQRHPRARCVLFTAHFLTVVNDVLQNGHESHPSLFIICDAIAFDFFNPEKVLGVSEEQVAAMSRLDVALRCARSLFFLTPTSYEGLDRRGQLVPAVDELAMVPIVDDDGYVLAVEPAEDTTKPKSRRRRAKVNQTTVPPPEAEEGADLDLDQLVREEEKIAKQRRRRRRKPRAGAGSSSGSEDSEARRQRKTERRATKRRRREAAAGSDAATGDLENPDMHDGHQMFTDELGRTCIVGDDGLVYQVQGDAHGGYSYVYQPGSSRPSGAANISTAAPADTSEEAAAAAYREAEDEAIRKQRLDRTIEAPRQFDSPLTLELVGTQGEAS